MSTGASVELDFFGMEKGNSSSSSKSQFQMLLEQRRNVRGVQSTMISKMNPHFLKSMIGCSGVPTAACVELGKLLLPVNVDGFIKKEVVSPPNNGADLLLLGMENIPVFKNPISRAAAAAAAASETADPGTLNSPLTIFYNGTVCVFDLPREKAEMIIKLAEEGKSSKIVESASPEQKVITDSSSTNKQELLEKLNQDLPKPGPSSGSNGQQELLEKLNGDLPIARKKSLQRFLAKRKERLTTISPYGSVGSEYAVEKKKLLLQE